MRRSLLALLLSLGATALPAAWSPTLTLTTQHDNNVSRSIRAAHADEAASARIALTQRRVLNRDWQGSLTFDASAVVWHTWDRLDQQEAGLSAGLRRKFGLGPYAPRLDFTAHGGHRFARVSARAADFASLRLAYGQRWSPALAWHAAFDLERHAANRRVFSGTTQTWSATIDWDVTPDWRLSASGRLREGDQVSWYRHDWPEYNGPGAWTDGIFGPNWSPYRSDARTRGLLLGLSRVLGERTSAALSFDWSRSTSAGGARVYSTGILSLSLAHAF